ncbi:hypothetical protein [Fuerstiella marisgermanici]|uniref:Uncharacterized protein n=1 Tax=Fuerstiella marisgermanici TaxID=1891926 RepID=A0A1P8WCV9_9PLAN|nr:hypothetical protein [Fuerstiella marisgermanici]APZ91898.1 hypothetical protein Fuma_01494 [Fuerstiella marisgermanici]
METRVSSSVAILTVVIAVGWLLAFWPARLLRPDDGVLWMTIAALSCLVPGWLIVLLEKLSTFQNDMKLILGQMSIRFASVAVAAVLVKVFRPDLGLVGFYGWLIGFYMLSMIVEVFLLRKKIVVESPSQPADDPLK